MKSYTTFLLLLVAYANTLYGQTPPVPLSYTEVVQLSDSVTKDDLFLRAREWFSESFKSSKEVLQIADKESGELVGKGILVVSYTLNYWGNHKMYSDVDFTISIWVKDGRYKYEMTNFNATPSSTNYFGGRIYSSGDFNYKYPGLSEKRSMELYGLARDAVDKEAKRLIEELKLKMREKPKSKDW